jgi:RES domain-containing protein
MPSQPSGPFIAFRIAENRFPLLDGGGAYRFGARWSSSGRHVIYAGLGFAVALIEQLGRSRLGKVPRDHHFAEIFIPATVTAEEVGPADVPGWERVD